MRLIAGVDEVGRGPLAGAVVTAAVILDPNNPIDGLADSKKLSEKKRDQLFDIIQQKALAFAFGRAEVHEIDQINILRASLLAMSRAVAALKIQPHHVMVDGHICPEVPMSVEAIIKGDATVACISAASILAKVARDREMLALHDQYPQYGFDKHKGYPTPVHLAALRKHGASAIHRRSYAPVQASLFEQ